MKVNIKLIIIVVIVVIITVCVCRYICTPNTKERFAIGFYNNEKPAGGIKFPCPKEMPTPRKEVLETAPDSYNIQISGFNYTEVPKFYIDGVRSTPLNLSQHYTSLTYNYTILGHGKSYVLETTEDIMPVVMVLQNDRWQNVDIVKVSNKDYYYKWLLNL